MARKRKRRGGGARAKWIRRLILLVLVAGVGVLAWLVLPFLQATDQFTDRPVKQPSRLYGEPVLLEVGRSASSGRLVEDLEAMGYRRIGDREPARGQYRLRTGALSIHLRSFPTPWGWNSGGMVEARWSGQRLSGLTWRGEEIRRISLEPPLLYSY